MTTATRPPRAMTADELLHMPDDGYCYELVRGELRKMLPAAIYHGIYAARIRDSALPSVYAGDLGELPIAEAGFLLDYDHVRVPDASFISRERFDAMDEDAGFFPGPPDIAVEVISPSDRLTDVAEKIQDYLDAGTLAVVVANPRNRAVAVHRPSGSITITESDILEIPELIPGWRMPVADIFK